MDGQAIFDISFQIICSSGEARSMAMEAISLAKEGKSHTVHTEYEKKRIIGGNKLNKDMS